MIDRLTIFKFAPGFYSLPGRKSRFDHRPRDAIKFSQFVRMFREFQPKPTNVSRRETKMVTTRTREISNVLRDSRGRAFPRNDSLLRYCKSNFLLRQREPSPAPFPRCSCTLFLILDLRSHWSDSFRSNVLAYVSFAETKRRKSRSSCAIRFPVSFHLLRH